MDQIKIVGDTSAVGGAVATFFGYLPDITALFALLYLLIRIWETATVQGLVSKLRRKNEAKQAD